jgi:hypothetical protein
VAEVNQYLLSVSTQERIPNREALGGG